MVGTPQLIISAPTSGAGKTTVARGLMALLTERGMKVQPFKCGPDYIDTKFHTAVCGRPSVNIDTFFYNGEQARQLYNRYATGADAVIVEGMMGLYDGYDRDRGSTADIARTLGLPIVLVVDARSAAYSMAPLLSGFIGFRKDIRIAGVIFNRVGSERHATMLRQVCNDLGVECFGCLPKIADGTMKSRYLGLDFSQRTEARETVNLIDKNINWRKLLATVAEKQPVYANNRAQQRQKRRIVVAQSEEAFSFVYQQTIDRLKEEGQVSFFNPEDNEPLPADTDLLYLPGGYPEKCAEALEAAIRTRRSIADYAARGGKIWAECGGMMYLCKEIVTDDGAREMCGVFPYSITARKTDRRLSLGYRRFAIDGKEYRGHEFHYTQFLGDQPETIAQVYNAKGEAVASPVIRKGGVVASYVHVGAVVTLPSTENNDGGEEERLRPIMLAGTGSDVGKSVVATALCRIFKQDGHHPAPFKAQNMALNSFATPDGLEIGRAQAVQAEAAGIACSTDMNPLLLKPNSDHTSQVVLNGRPAGNQKAYDYFRGGPGREALRHEVCAAFDRLARQYNPIVMEGAGSISELNLIDTDIVNMPMAEHAQANVVLVADIDRGGVFASTYGSIVLQKPEHRRLIKGIIINKFRGDIRLFESGRRLIEQLCGVPVLGVIPYFGDIHIEEEDSVSLAQKSMQAQHGRVNVAVVLLRHISNYTDFDVLERDPRAHLFYTNNTDDIGHADIIIIPGSKSTMADLYELRRNGVAQAILNARRQGHATILGICGGYQMMGRYIEDPDHVEGDVERLPGLGLLPTITRMTKEKVTRQCQFTIEQSATTMHGYEIHMGETKPTDGAKESPLAVIADGKADGYVADERCMGTYIHGILDNADFIDRLLKPYAERTNTANSHFDYKAYKEEQYNKLADHVRRHIDMDKLYKIMRGKQ